MTPEEPGVEFLGGADASRRYILEEKRMYLQSGALGRVFGSPEIAPMNIAGLVVGLLLGAGVVLMATRGVNESVEYFKTIFPLVTLALGYLFGKKRDTG